MTVTAKFILFFLSTSAWASGGSSPNKDPSGLALLAAFRGQQVTGVTLSDSGRLFAAFPRWRDSVKNSVVEILPNGATRPFPNKDWNNWNGTPSDGRFTCVQSVLAYGDSLYVLDPASPGLLGVIGRPKLYEFDLRSDSLKHTWTFDETVAPEKSYLNDLQVDDLRGKIYITDSGLGSLLVLDTQSGKTRRLLDASPSTAAENISIKVGDRVVTVGERPARFNVDGIALEKNRRFLYYHALTGYTLYRISIDALNDETLGAAQLEAAVEKIARTPAPDGMIFDPLGNLYMADLENNAIVYRTPAGDIRQLAKDDRIAWADSFAIDKINGALIFSTSRINETPPGVANDDVTYNVYRISLLQPAAADATGN